MPERVSLIQGDQGATLVHEDPRTAPMLATPPDLRDHELASGTITELQILGTAICYPLAVRREYLLGGGEQADVVIEDGNVSRRHARLLHQGAVLRVIDLGSTNGTYCAGHRVHDVEVRAGQIFEVSRRMSLLVLDDPLRLLRDGLYWILGLRAHAAVGEALRSVVSGAPLAFLGPAGCDQGAIAAQIHRATALRTHTYRTSDTGFSSAEERRAIVESRDPAVVFLDLHQAAAPLPAPFVAHLFRDCNRPIVAAPDPGTARRALDVYANKLHAISVPRVAARPGEAIRLLEALITHLGQGSAPAPPLPLVTVGADNLRALAGHGWPENIDDLRRTATRLHALLTHNLGVRAAARYLGRAHSSLVAALARVGVRFPTEPGDDLDADEAAGPLADMVHPVPPEAAQQARRGGDDA